MADPEFGDIDQPRGRVRELVATLRELGLADAAEIIVSDILFRRRGHLRRGRPRRIDPVRPEQFNPRDEAEDRYESPQVTPLEDQAGPPLSNEEQVAIALRVLELAVVNPLRMIEEATLLTSDISVSGREGHPVGLQLQFGDQRAGVPWMDGQTRLRAEELRVGLGRLADWLHGR